MKRIYIVTLIEVLIILLGIGIYVFYTIKKHGNILGENPFGSYGENFFKNHSLLANAICHFLVYGLSLFILIELCIPVIMDFPAAMNDEYMETSGYVVRWDITQENTNKLRRISIIDEENAELHLNVYGYSLHKDEYIKVRYFKHSKYGKVVYE